MGCHSQQSAQAEGRPGTVCKEFTGYTEQGLAEFINPMSNY